MSDVKLDRYLSPAGAWAFALGTSIGWGSFVITSNTYLHGAGPVGSVLGMLIGAAIMLVIARNYHYLMNRYPDAGGAYSYAKHIFGHDHGFLTAWFLGITYLAILWANATSLPLFARYFLGSAFQIGPHYIMFGYDVYLGEVFLSILAILLIGLLCINAKRLASALMVGLAAVIVIGIVICFGAGMTGAATPATSGEAQLLFNPAFAPDGNAIGQVVLIACISPWAFIGFESISQSTEEFSFERKRSFKVLATAVLASTLLYIFVILLSVTAYPPQFDNWFDYINNLDSLQGIEALPGFYATSRYLGSFGVNLLFVSLFALIVTSLIGNITALSRLFFALGKDGILPQPLSELNNKQVPYKAVLAVMAISCIVPFLGRTAIGWIVDVTTIGATIVYGFVSAAAHKAARERGDALEKHTGLIGLIAMIVVGALLMLPNLFSSSTMAPESFFLFIVWSLIGLMLFHRILRTDPENRFGESVIVWIALLAFVMFMSFVWLEQESENHAIGAMSELQAHYVQDSSSSSPPDENAASDNSQADDSQDAFFNEQVHKVHVSEVGDTLIVLFLFALSFGLMISNYSYMRRKQTEDEFLLGVERIRANTDSLTGVRNKTAYAEAELDLNERIAKGTIENFTICVFDMNGLKEINDSMGHDAGDECIRNACKMICDRFKRSPVFRTGGDEFVVIAEGEDRLYCEELLGELVKQSEENCRVGGVVIAGGMSEFKPSTDKEVKVVFDRADKLMYQCKSALKQLSM